MNQSLGKMSAAGDSTYETRSQYTYSVSSSVARRQLLKRRAQLTELEAIIQEKMHIERQLDMLDEAEGSSEGDPDRRYATPEQCFSAIAQAPEPEPLKKPPIEPRGGSGNEDVVKNLTEALKRVVLPKNSDLPIFDGRGADWLPFKEAYEKVKDCSQEEKMRLLRLSLRGEAKEAVSALLQTSASPEAVMRCLALRFGRPDRIIKQQISIVRNLPTLNENPEDIAIFATKINNCVAIIQALHRREYLYSIDIAEEIILKLSPHLRCKWTEWADKWEARDECQLVCLAEFLNNEAERALRYLPDACAARAAPQPWRAGQQAVGSAPPPPPAPVQSAAGRSQLAASSSVAHAVNASNKGEREQCICCQSDHLLTKCDKFKSFSVDERWTLIKNSRKCFRCLNFNHPAKACKISKYLHKLLHKPKQPSVDCLESTSGQVGHSTGNSALESEIKPSLKCALLKVVPIRVQGSRATVETYALLDEGASISLIDSDLAAEIGDEGPSGQLNVMGIGSMNMQINSKCLKVKVLPRSNDAVHEINVRTIHNLNLSAQSINKSELLTHKHVRDLSDVIPWYVDAKPKMLIGQDNWPLIVSRELRTGASDQPVVSKTLLGWIVHGTCGGTAASQILHISHSSSDDELHTLIKESFELDNIGITIKQRHNELEERANEILSATTKRYDSNTWETGLLWCNDEIDLPDNTSSTLKRFYNLEQKLINDPSLAAAYSAQVHKLLDLGYAVPCVSPPVPGKFWTLPLFAVIKPGKIRLVFDCAAKFRHTSLNDQLLTGPDLLQSLLGVLMKFRQAPIAFVGDIKDMYLRIKIKEEDQEYQRFFWREPGTSSPPTQFKMTAMVFGAACSPCSAIYTLNANAKESEEEYPEAAQAIKLKHYMDDYLDSCYTEQEAIKLVTSVIKVHSRGGFDIRRWASNSAVVLQAIPEEKRASGNITLTSDMGTTEKTLGMIWQPTTDNLGFNVSMSRVPKAIATGQERPTKRQMLSVIMSVFDPLGLLSPLSVRGKILLQEVWRSNIKWDEKLADREYLKWKMFIREIQAIEKCQVPRCYSSRKEKPVTISLHTFCDASEKAFSAACYFKMVYADGGIDVNLVAAKARVTPLKPISIPRLELQAALLGARLADTVLKEHEFKIDEKYYWSDSITTLVWLRSDPRNYKAFVGHRLSAIDELTKVTEWKWVPTANNVADLATRDSAPLDLSPDSKWFKGPDFLKEPIEEWPREKIVIKPSESAVCEEKVHAVLIKTVKKDLPDISRFSSWSRLIRATAYVLLFVDKMLKKPGNAITVEHLKKAEEMWIKQAQEDSYLKEISYLIKKEKVPVDSNLVQLTPTLDEAGIMRAKGRILAAPGISTDQKQPVILSGSHPYTKLLIHHYHVLYNHGSTETVVNEMKQKFWITNLRSAVRSSAFHCQLCKIKKAVPAAPPMGDLPFCRLDHHKRPFSQCGLDYFGPIEVAIGRRREKRYGALFTCMVTRAVHMELAGSLTSDAVIMAIRRLIARRGAPTAIYSDNGSNFKGADAELKRAFKDLNLDSVEENIVNRGIEWHFIPATAAHMGGAWERLVQSIKKALKATLNERAPREEVLHTLLTEAELTVNSRPLTHVSVDHRDDETLTPNHFLIGSSSGRPIPGKFDDKDLMLRKQWKVAQRLADMFWARWVKEYLPTLVRRTMPVSAGPQKDIQVNDLVIICDSNLPRNMWPRGIVIKTFPGKDTTVRVADVKTSGGVFRRPVHKLIVLPVADSLSNTPTLNSNVVARMDVRRDRARGGGVVNVGVHCAP